MTVTTIKELEALVANVKQQFEAYISDPSTPLQERWDEWIKAPSYLKNHKNWIQTLDSVPRAFEYDDNYERHQTVLMDEDILDRLFESWNDEEPKFKNKEEFQEEILTKNLGSFEYDW